MDWPFLLKSASNACPIASWRRIPEAPAPITTGISPPLGRLASKEASILPVISDTISPIRVSVSISAPVLKLLETFLTIFFPFCSAVRDAWRVVIGRVSYFSSPNELYIR